MSMFTIDKSISVNLAERQIKGIIDICFVISIVQWILFISLNINLNPAKKIQGNGT